MQTAYDEILYPTSPQARLHPDNLYLCGVLNGFRPVPPENARVLEIACGTGFNLVPMALELPNAQFIGMDYAALPIQVGTEIATELGASNLALHHADLTQPDLDFGSFDYIVAHGLYSWVPDPVRDALWRFVQRSLSPQGIFHVSYNALPGWYPTYAMRDYLREISAGIDAPAQRLERCWKAVQALAAQSSHRNLLVAEAKRLATLPSEVMFHDELADDNRPFYLAEVVGHAQQHQMRYAGEGDLRVPTGVLEDAGIDAGWPEPTAHDILQRDRMRAFSTMRRFHDSLFARISEIPEAVSLPDALSAVWAHSNIRQVGRTETQERTYEHSNGVQLTTGHPLVCALADALQTAAPGSIQIGAFWQDLQEKHPEMHPGLKEQFWLVFRQLAEAGAVKLRMRNVPVASGLADCPVTLPFIRIQSRWDAFVTNVYHESSQVPEDWQRVLLSLLDGTRDREQLLQGLTDSCWQGVRDGVVPGQPRYAPPMAIAEAGSLRANPAALESQESLKAFFRERIEEVLKAFWLAGYLV
jgi:SAM-dependent methyltransferase